MYLVILYLIKFLQFYQCFNESRPIVFFVQHERTEAFFNNNKKRRDIIYIIHEGQTLTYWKLINCNKENIFVNV